MFPISHVLFTNAVVKRAALQELLGHTDVKTTQSASPDPLSPAILVRPCPLYTHLVGQHYAGMANAGTASPLDRIRESTTPYVSYQPRAFYQRCG